MRAHFAAMPRARLVADIDAVSRCVLRNDEQFFGARGNKLFGFAQNCIGAATDEFAPNIGDNAEGAGPLRELDRRTAKEQAVPLREQRRRPIHTDVALKSRAPAGSAL